MIFKNRIAFLTLTPDKVHSADAEPSSDPSMYAERSAQCIQVTFSHFEDEVRARVQRGEWRQALDMVRWGKDLLSAIPGILRCQNLCQIYVAWCALTGEIADARDKALFLRHERNRAKPKRPE